MLAGPASQAPHRVGLGTGRRRVVRRDSSKEESTTDRGSREWARRVPFDLSDGRRELPGGHCRRLYVLDGLANARRPAASGGVIGRDLEDRGEPGGEAGEDLAAVLEFLRPNCRRGSFPPVDRVDDASTSPGFVLYPRCV
jgi:hypothetical protein